MTKLTYAQHQSDTYEQLVHLRGESARHECSPAQQNAAPDRPRDFGLSDNPLYLNEKEYPVRVELVGAVASEDAAVFGSILGTTAFYIMRSQRIVHPGSVLEDAVSVYIPETTLPHMYVTAPFLWEQKLCSTELETKNVAWLLAFPISQAELGFLREKGGEALEDMFEQHNIDMFDLHREAVV